MWQHRAVAPTQAVQEAAQAIFHHPVLLVKTPSLKCQDVYLTFRVSSSLPLVKGDHKTPKLILKLKDEKHQHF